MVPHGGYTVPNSPTRYVYPAPSHDIRSSRGAIFALKMAKPGAAAKFPLLAFFGSHFSNDVAESGRISEFEVGGVDPS